MSRLNFTKPKKSSNVFGKVYEVIKNSKRDFDGIVGQGKESRFGKQGAFITRDPDYAREINERYGHGPGGTRDVIVVERDEYAASSRRNLFTVPDVPWHREERDKK
jgi:hypothetical protein